MRAAAPATCGVAIEVPDMVAVPPVREVDWIDTPGAQIWTQLPYEENEACSSTHHEKDHTVGDGSVGVREM